MKGFATAEENTTTWTQMLLISSIANIQLVQVEANVSVHKTDYCPFPSQYLQDLEINWGRNK